jgi:hypothetical protein
MYEVDVCCEDVGRMFYFSDVVFHFVEDFMDFGGVATTRYAKPLSAVAPAASTGKTTKKTRQSSMKERMGRRNVSD